MLKAQRKIKGAPTTAINAHYDCCDDWTQRLDSSLSARAFVLNVTAKRDMLTKATAETSDVKNTPLRFPNRHYIVSYRELFLRLQQ